MANKNREKNINNNGLPVCNINWYIPTLVNFQVNLDFISLFI